MFQQVEFFYEGLMSLVFIAPFTTWQVFADKMASSIQMMFNFISNYRKHKEVVGVAASSLLQPVEEYTFSSSDWWLPDAYLRTETAKTIHAIKSSITKVLSITFLWKG